MCNKSHLRFTFLVDLGNISTVVLRFEIFECSNCYIFKKDSKQVISLLKQNDSHTNTAKV